MPCFAVHDSQKKKQRQVSVQWKEVHWERWKRRTAERLHAAHRVLQYITLCVTHSHILPFCRVAGLWALIWVLVIGFFLEGVEGVWFIRLNSCRNVVLFHVGLVQLLEILRILHYYCKISWTRNKFEA